MFKKRFLALLLVLAMCFTLMPLSAFADTDESDSTLTFKLDLGGYLLTR